VSKSIGLGRSSRRERSWREAPTHRGSCLGQGPWPVKSWLAASRKRRCHPQFRVTTERSGPWNRLRQRATAGEVLRSLAIRGCARGPYRLQKSTSGAWPFAPVNEEFAGPTMGLALPRESARKGERASEAGSSVAKPRDRWRVPANRSDCESCTPGSTCRGKALWAGISRSH
jgi:hypothetical protein